MPITARKSITAPPRRAPAPPSTTMGMVEVAARYWGGQFGWAEEKSRALFFFAIADLASAEALVKFAVHLASCQVAEEKLRHCTTKVQFETAEAPRRNLLACLKAERERDVREGGDRLLAGISRMRKLDLTTKQRVVVVSQLAKAFAPPEETPVEEGLYRVVVGERGSALRLADFIVRQFLDATETVAYEATLEAAAPTPAPAEEEPEEVAKAS